MDILNDRVTPKVSDALYRMRQDALTGENTVTGRATHGGAALRVSTFTVFKIGRRVLNDQVAKRLIAFIKTWHQFFCYAEDGIRFSPDGMRLWLDKGSVYVFKSSEAVDERYAKDRLDFRRKHQAKRNKTYPHCFLNPSLDMLIYADNYIEASLALHGYGTTGEPMLQIPTPQEPEWWRKDRKYTSMANLLLGEPGREIQYFTSRGACRSFTQTAAAFDGLNDRIQKLTADLEELGLPVPK